MSPCCCKQTAPCCCMSPATAATARSAADSTTNTKTVGPSAQRQQGQGQGRQDSTAQHELQLLSCAERWGSAMAQDKQGINLRKVSHKLSAPLWVGANCTLQVTKVCACKVHTLTDEAQQAQLCPRTHHKVQQADWPSSQCCGAGSP